MKNSSVDPSIISSPANEESQLTDCETIISQQISNKSDNYKHFTDGFTRYNDKLTDKLLEYSSTKLDNVAKPGCCGRTTANLSKQGLKYINVLKHHNYITYLNLSGNYLTNLSTLSNLPFLEYLDVSQNLLSTLLDFSPPINLTYANFSYNLIQNIPQLGGFWSLECLNVSHNLLTAIYGLQKMSYLEHLDLSYNYIEKIDGLNGLNLLTVILDNNEISNFSDANLYQCEAFSVANNYLSSLEVFAKMPNLKKLNASNNEIKNFIELTYLSKKMTWLDLTDNPITKKDLYVDTALVTMQRLNVLDNEEVDAYKKAEAVFKLAPSEKQVARNYNVTMYMITYTSNREIDNVILPYPQLCIPIMVLFGPNGTRTRDLLELYFSSFSNQNIHKRSVVVGLSHTTRPRAHEEVEGEDYYFIKRAEFNRLLENGEFLTFVSKFGHFYGIARSEIQKGSPSKVLLFMTDLSAGLQLKEKLPAVKLVSAQPRKEATYRQWLHRYYGINTWISTFITAYKIITKSIPLESRKTTNDKKLMCYSILQEIIDYIELVHERHQSQCQPSGEQRCSYGYFDCNEKSEHLNSVLASSMQSMCDITSIGSTEVIKVDTVDNIDKATIKLIPPWLSTMMMVGQIHDVKDAPAKMSALASVHAAHADVDEQRQLLDVDSTTTTLIDETLEKCYSEEQMDYENDEQRKSLMSITSSFFSIDGEHIPSSYYDSINVHCLEEFIKYNIKLFRKCNRLLLDISLTQVHTDEPVKAVRTLSHIIQQYLEYYARKTKESDKHLKDLMFDELLTARYNHIIDTSY